MKPVVGRALERKHNSYQLHIASGAYRTTPSRYRDPDDPVTAHQSACKPLTHSRGCSNDRTTWGRHDLKSESDIVYYAGRYLPATDACLGVLSAGIVCGPVPYETVRAFRSHDGEATNLFRADAHFLRLFGTLQSARYEHELDACELTRVLCELILRNRITGDASFRLHAFATDRAPGPSVATQTNIAIGVEDRPLLCRDPVRARIAPWRRALGVEMSVRAKVIGNPPLLRGEYMEAKAQGFEQIVVLNADRTVSEAGYGNIFCVFDDVLTTPPEDSLILLGITRDTVLHLASDLGLEVAERKIDSAELSTADEIFACASGLDIMPIGEIDGSPIGNGRTGPVTRKIARAYAEAVRGKWPGRESWLVAVDSLG